MSSNEDTRDEELLARYRRASADEASHPSEAVRASILAESRRVADELAKCAPPSGFDTSRPAVNDARWKITAFGTLGAALLAALIFAPRYWENSAPHTHTAQIAPVPAASQEAAPAAAPAPKLEEVAPSVAASNATPPAPPAPPAPPPGAAENYAPVSPAVTNAIESATAPGASGASGAPGAPAAPTARIRVPELSARAAAGAALPLAAGKAASTDSAQKATTLQAAVAQGDVAQATSLLDQGAVIDARDEAGRTPLMLAVAEDKIEIVRLLLARGADPNAADHSGQTPLQQAKRRNLQEVAALLEQSGAR